MQRLSYACKPSLLTHISPTEGAAKRSATRGAQAYCDRWQIEMSFFVMKQEFALEKVRVRTFRRLENIFSLCVLAYVYATQFLRRTKGFKRILKFLADNLGTVSSKTHALLAGIRALMKELSALARAELSSFLARFVRILNPAFDRIRKARDESRCLYVARAFPWTFIVGFLMRLGSRNCMDANRNGGGYADAVLKLAQQGEWPEGEKQDSEYHAFLRMAPRLKAAFPNLGICILGDALYACAPLMRICEGFGRDYIFTFKEGRTPTAYADAQVHIPRVPDPVTGSGRSDGPEIPPEANPSDSRRTALPCRDCAGSTRDVTKSGLQMTPAARRSRDVGVICNLWCRPRSLDGGKRI